MIVLQLAFKSLINRRISAGLTMLSIAICVALFIGIERIREGTKESFANTISQTDLIVGGRSGAVQLLLYTVFRIGNPTNNVAIQSFNHFSSHPAVAWTIPYSLGDSHRGFRVVATNAAFYEHYRFHGDKQVRWTTGGAPSKMFDVALGSVVAKELGYQVNDPIVIGHGVADEVIVKHDDKPFKIVGILEPTGTPIDRSLYITLEGMEAIHMDWSDGAPPLEATPAEQVEASGVEVTQITAFLLRTKDRVATLRLQREINDFAAEPLMAVIPGVALQELWDGLSYAENGFRVISMLVVIVGLMGMGVALMNSLERRRREIAILRANGASRSIVWFLLITEAGVLTSLGAVLGVSFAYASIFVLRPWVTSAIGVQIPLGPLTLFEMGYIVVLIAFGFLTGVFPAIQAYRQSLADGLTVRV